MVLKRTVICSQFLSFSYHLFFLFLEVCTQGVFLGEGLYDLSCFGNACFAFHDYACDCFCNLVKVFGIESSGGCCGGSEADTGGYEGALGIVGNRILIGGLVIA